MIENLPPAPLRIRASKWLVGPIPMRAPSHMEKELCPMRVEFSMYGSLSQMWPCRSKTMLREWPPDCSSRKRMGVPRLTEKTGVCGSPPTLELDSTLYQVL